MKFSWNNSNNLAPHWSSFQTGFEPVVPFVFRWRLDVCSCGLQLAARHLLSVFHQCTCFLQPDYPQQISYQQINIILCWDSISDFVFRFPELPLDPLCFRVLSKGRGIIWFLCFLLLVPLESEFILILARVCNYFLKPKISSSQTKDSLLTSHPSSLIYNFLILRSFWLKEIAHLQ